MRPHASRAEIDPSGDFSRLPFAGSHVLVVTAHCDDEVLFAGTQLSHCAKLTIVNTTDSVTTERAARRKGFRNRAHYAAVRRRELHDALAIGGITAECLNLSFRDRRLSFEMGEATQAILRILERFPPDIVLTHAYEGGHLDHDATCFAVHSAMRRRMIEIPIWEFAGYHQQGAQFVPGQFPNDNGPLALTVHLNNEQLSIKQKMLSAFKVPEDGIKLFSLQSESFRIAPHYDFTRAPFSGKLLYEKNSFWPEGRLWRAVAASEQWRDLRVKHERRALLVSKMLLWLSLKSGRLQKRHPSIFGSPSWRKPVVSASPTAHR
jgi:LmbE family N-acetylglucosaminyl deacetylase